MHPIANHHHELELFKKLLDASDPLRILCFYGESGRGKTTLLKACLSMCSLTKVIEDFKNITTLESFIDNFIECLVELSTLENLQQEKHNHQARIDHNLIPGSGNSLTINQYESQEALEKKYMRLAKALLLDLQQLDKPLIIVLDSYEKANSEIKQWIEGFLLKKIEVLSKVHILLVGQSVPPADLKWEAFAKHCELNATISAKDWRKFAKERYPNCSDEKLTLLEGLCALDGANLPSNIAKVLEASLGT